MDPVCVVPWRAVPRWSWVAAGGSGVSVHRVKCPPELTLRWWAAAGGGGAAPAGLPCSATHRSSDTCLSQGDTGSWEQTNTSTSLTQHPHTRATSPSPMPDILNILLQHYYYIWNNTTISLSVLYVVRWSQNTCVGGDLVEVVWCRHLGPHTRRAAASLASHPANWTLYTGTFNSVPLRLNHLGMDMSLLQISSDFQVLLSSIHHCSTWISKYIFQSCILFCYTN